MSLNNLAKATSIRQRYDLLKKYYVGKTESPNTSSLENYKKWRSRPTTVTDERFEEILQSARLTKEEFDLAIKELTEEEKDYIFSEIQTDDWLQMTQEILEQDDHLVNDVFDESKANFTYALRLHIDYFERKLKEILKEFSEVEVQASAMMDYVGEVINRFMDIGLRTYVYDLHVTKEKLEIEPELDEKKAFQKYLISRFDSKEKVADFFAHYPVLARLYAETISFQLVNFKELMEALDESQDELNDIFKLRLPLSLTGLKMGAGDSHDRGKSVAILTFHGESELVYKPKI